MTSLGRILSAALAATAVLSHSARAQGTARYDLARQIAQVVAADPVDVMRSSFDALTAVSNVKAVSDVIGAFYAKYLPKDTVVAITAAAYARAFEESELRAILAWVSTPLGKRFIAGQTQIATDARNAMALIIAPHHGELLQAIQSAMMRRP